MKVHEIQEKISNAKRVKITQTDIAKALEISREAVHQRAKNNSDFSPQQIQKIEQYFQVNLTSVKGGTEATEKLPGWLENMVSGAELEEFEELVKKDKHLLLLLFKARRGDKQAVKALNQLLQTGLSDNN